MEASNLLLEIFLLGNFRVATSGRVLETRAWRLRRAQQLVKMLALAPQHRLTVDAILDALWHGRSPKAARHSLHQAVSYARIILGSTRQDRAALLLWEQDWISLCPADRAWIDVAQFEEAAQTARRTRTIDAYQAALSCYRGELLPDDRYAEWTLRRREELRELQLELRVELAALYERASQEPDARALLESIIADDALREDAHRALMRLYLRKGQPQRAMRLWEKLRANLRRELDAEPEPATLQLYERARARQTFESAPALPPLPLTSLVGREKDRAAIEQLLPKKRLVTLTGPAGCGKTRLALECAHTAALDNTVYWIELAPLADPALLPNVIANRLGIQEQGPGAITQRVITFLQNDAGLLALDNCEHLLPAIARLVQMLLEQCGGLRILATSRERLRVAGETIWQVGALEYPRQAELLDHNTQQPYPAVRLFVERARALAPTLEIDGENAAPIAALCRELEGIPLALELAAARVNVLSIQQISSALDDALQALAPGVRAPLARHQSMRAALDWSYALLSSGEQKLWARLSVFRGDFDLEAANVVCGEPGNPPLLGVLASLIDKSLVQAKTARGEMRYRLHEMVRQFGVEKLRAAGELEMQRTKHYAYFVALAEQANQNLSGAEQALWIMHLDAALENLRAALEWSKAAPDKLLGLSATLWRYWYVRGLLTEGRRWLDAALREDVNDSRLRASALIGSGVLCWGLGDLARAAQLCMQGLELARATNELFGQGWAQLVLGVIAEYRAEFVNAMNWQSQSVDSFIACGDAFGRALALHALGITMQAQGQALQARAYFEASLELHRSIGSIWGIAVTQNNFGTLELSEGNFVQARARLEESYKLLGILDAQAGLGTTANLLGLLALQENDLARAAELLEISMRHFQRIGDAWGIARVWHSLAWLGLKRGELASALEKGRQSLQGRFRLGDPVGVAECWELLAQIAVAQKQFARAAQMAGAAENLRQQRGSGEFVIARDLHLQAQTEMRAHLGERAFAREWARGQTRTLEETMRVAMED